MDRAFVKLIGRPKSESGTCLTSAGRPEPKPRSKPQKKNVLDL